MKRFGAVFATLLFVSAASLAQTLPELFQKAKAQVKGESWTEALETLDALEAEAAGPGNEAAQQQLAAPTAFYRGVCDANLGNAERAQADFATFLRENPGSTIDKVMYSKKAVAAFEAAGKNVAFEAASTEAASGGSLSLYQRFEKFKAPADMGETPDDRWADGPVKWIMTAEEKAAWRGLTGGAERAGFVEEFWERRNPKPGSEDNIARTGFDRRVAFADTYFQPGEQQRGSLTDAGRKGGWPTVIRFTSMALGPPTLPAPFARSGITGERPCRRGSLLTR
jgi:GWxTD domain-containing protein